MKGSMFRQCLLTVLLLGLSLFAVSARAQAPSFEASAAVPVQEDLVKARSQALSDALGRALEQAVTQVAPEARSRVYLILGRARDYVTTYRVLDEGELAGQFQIRVTVQFELSRVLRDLQGDKARPSAEAAAAALIVCTPSTTAEAQTVLAAARALLSEQGAATDSLPAAACADRLKSGAAMLALVLDENPQTAEVRGTQPVRVGALAHVEWRLFRGSGGPFEPLRESGEGTVFLDSAANAVAEAQRLAALTSLRTLLKKPGLGLPIAGKSGGGVLITLESVGSYGNYRELVKAMSALPGVSRVEPRRFFTVPASSPGGGTPTENTTPDKQIQVLLHTTATAETIGAALGRAPLGGLRLQVAPLGPSELRVICTSASNLPSAADENQPEAPAPEAGGTP